MAQHRISVACADSDESGSKSKALVPYRGSPWSSFVQLPRHIDLNVPPDNWLRGQSLIEKHIETSLRRKQAGISHSSIDMAEDNMDSVADDQLDVISDAKNIKKLLAIPFSSEPVSLMVHRVGNTLLIDEFDIHKLILREQQKDWKWLRNFYLQLIENRQIQTYQRPSKSNADISEQNMFSKFLYYSIQAAEEGLEAEMDEQLEEHIVSQLDAIQGNRSRARSQSRSDSGDTDPSFADDLPTEYTRTVEWNFEDIKMLIGSDLPIFRDGGSCVSLRLRDVNRPITVLTGLDYWLDNLMSNVPEIAMCYHSNGFVEKYERISTSEIPNLRGAEFQPNFVKDVAQNILSFLKSKATKVGHTYWLYKDRKGDIIKLYDLTSLCESSCDDTRTGDPFRIPLANLLLRVAIRLLDSRQMNKAGMIEMLLTNAITLFDDQQPKLSITAHLLLCELYLLENSKCFDEDSEPSDDDFDLTQSDQVDDLSESTQDELPIYELPLTSLSKRTTKPKAKVDTTRRFPVITSDKDNKCLSALQRVAEALLMVDDGIERLEESSNEPPPNVPPGVIPLPYRPLSRAKVSPLDERGYPPEYSSEEQKSSLQLLSKRHQIISNTWLKTSKVELLCKAHQSAVSLAESHCLILEHGHTLRYIKLALLCYDAMTRLDPDMMEACSSSLYQSMKICGDTRLRLAGNPNDKDYASQYYENSNDNLKIADSCAAEILSPGYEWAYMYTEDAKTGKLSALRCYQMSKDIITADRQFSTKFVNSRLAELNLPSTELSIIIKRLGNCCNEMATYYMNKANQLYNQARDVHADSAGLVESDVTSLPSQPIRAEITEHLNASSGYFEKGISYFKDVQDVGNVALLICNSTRINRIQAQVLLPFGSRGEFSQAERVLYDKAIYKLKEALTLIGKRESLPQIHDLISFELSGVYCSLASMLQDFTPTNRTRAEIQRHVIDLMSKALVQCESGMSNKTQQVMRQYRSATVHHRLASLYHSTYRDNTQADFKKSRYTKSLSESHYSKAHALFDLLESYSELLRLTLERVALLELEVQHTQAVNNKIRLLESALNLLLQHSLCLCLKSFTDDNANLDESEMTKLLEFYTQRLQAVSLQIVKLLSSSTKKSHSSRVTSSGPDPLAHYKNIYRATLNIKQASSARQSSSNVLENLQEYFHYSL